MAKQIGFVMVRRSRRAPVKRCGCGRAWSAAGWAGLPLVGVQDGFGAPDLELRNCV